MSSWIKLDDWVEIKISGPQTIEYLNGIITKDIIKVKPGTIVRSGFLTPNAKVRSIFWLRKSGDNKIYFYCHPDMKQALVEDLLKYKLSMDVKLEDISGETPDLYLIETDEKIPGLSNADFGYTFVNLEDEPEGEELSYPKFLSLLVTSGISPVEIMVGENPYELGIDDIITLEKGCFLGQEPISRMYHRGNPRKYVYQVEFNTADVNATSIINQDDTEVGEVLMVDGTTGLAFLRRTLENFNNLTIDGNDVKVTERIGTYPKNDR